MANWHDTKYDWAESNVDALATSIDVLVAIAEMSTSVTGAMSLWRSGDHRVYDHMICGLSLAQRLDMDLTWGKFGTDWPNQPAKAVA
jgi:hypothetical protein